MARARRSRWSATALTTWRGASRRSRSRSLGSPSASAASSRTWARSPRSPRSPAPRPSRSPRPRRRRRSPRSRWPARRTRWPRRLPSCLSSWPLSHCGSDGTDARSVLLHMLVRVVTGADERAGGDVLEPELVRRRLERLELVGVPVADDRQVALGRAQVLADGEDRDARLAHVGGRRDPLVVPLTQAAPHAELGHDLALAELERVAEHAQRARPARA